MTECDEVDKWHKREKHTIKLFGKDLYFDNTLDIIAKRAGTPVIAAFLERTGKHSYTLHFEDVSVEKKSESIARDTLSLWEKYVIKKPDQWYQWKKWADMKVAS
jgi:lauroyl/myristoyl acyltransferase